jgi:hypothetical protein
MLLSSFINATGRRHVRIFDLAATPAGHSTRRHYGKLVYEYKGVNSYSYGINGF